MTSLAHHILKRPSVLYALVACAAILLMASFSALFDTQLSQWEERLGSRTWSVANQNATERRVVVVDIDEKSTQELGAWPWPRDRTASLLSALDAYGVNLKVVDVLFDGTQNTAQDAKLAAALGAGAPTVISQLFALSPDAQVKSGELSGALNSSQSTATGPCPLPSTAAYGFMAPASVFTTNSLAVGHITPVVDPDGGIRRVPALVCFEGKAYPALALAALSAATGAQPVLKTNQSIYESAQILDVGGLQLPVDARGQLRVSYQMPRSAFHSVSAVDVIQGKAPANLLKGAWVLVGSTAFGGGDAVPTPQGGAVGGVEVHAQILSAALDSRTPFVPAWAPLWPILTGALALVVLIFAVRFSGSSAALLVPATALGLCAALFGVHAFLLLSLHQWLAWGQPAVFVVLFASMLTAAEMLRVRAERESLFQNLSSYLPEGAARRVAFEELTANVVAETREATVMLVDLRNFSAYCEEREPEDAATVLHIFYTTIERIVADHGGVVEQMVGDGLTAVWNGSSPCQFHTAQALKAAKVIWQEGVAQLPKVSSRKTPPLDIGIGIECGPVLVGSFGPARRRVHTVMGETVSVAARLENLTAELGYPVLLGPRAMAQALLDEQQQGQKLGSLASTFEAQKLGDFLLAGMRTPRTIYALSVPIGADHLRLISSLEAGALG